MGLQVHYYLTLEINAMFVLARDMKQVDEYFKGMSDDDRKSVPMLQAKAYNLAEENATLMTKIAGHISQK
jgi:hypothetical protein